MPEKRLVIHAGSHKTGSSAIQRYLFDHREELGDVCYLHWDRPNASLWMLQGFKQDIAELPAFRHRQLDEAKIAGMRERARDVLAQQAAGSDAGLAILSAESIATFSVEELRELREFLAPYYERIELHQYFRPLKARMESAFQEKLKHTVADLDQTFRLAYIRTIELQDSVFGREHVHSYKYDGDSFPGGDVVMHFLAQLGLEFDTSRPADPVNISLSLPAIQLLYVYRKFYPGPFDGDRPRVQQLAALPGVPLRFHSDLYAALIVIRPGEVERFEARAGFSVAENISADDDIAIRGEADLLAVPDASIDWLQAQTGSTATIESSDLRAIAELVAALG